MDEEESSSFVINGRNTKLPIGVRFLPTDEIVVDQYLKRKAFGLPIPITSAILDFNVFQTDPWHLPGVLSSKFHVRDSLCDINLKTPPVSPFLRCLPMPGLETGIVTLVSIKLSQILKSMEEIHTNKMEKRYFFTKQRRFLRKRVGCGIWKSNGKQSFVLNKGFNQVIGVKKSLVYSQRTTTAAATGWAMDEYRLPSKTQMESGDWAVYCLFQRKRRPRRQRVEEESSSSSEVTEEDSSNGEEESSRDLGFSSSCSY